MQRGDLDGPDLEEYVEQRLLTTTMDKAIAWARGNAMWPATFGLACCAIEMMSMVSARYDTARYGAEVFRASPRQADMLILSGRVSIKMVPVIRRIYDQMLEPKWVLSMGACSSSGGMFANYAVVQGADKFLPVDIHIPGCPPRPEALMYGILKLRDKVLGDPDLGWRDQYAAHGTEEDERPWQAGAIRSRAGRRGPLRRPARRQGRRRPRREADRRRGADQARPGAGLRVGDGPRRGLPRAGHRRRRGELDAGHARRQRRGGEPQAGDGRLGRCLTHPASS